MSRLDSGGSEDFNGLLKMRSQQKHPRPWIKVILVVGVEQSGVDPKQRYSNRLTNPLGIEQLELQKEEAHIQGYVLGFWDAQYDWIVLLRYKKVNSEKVNR